MFTDGRSAALGFLPSDGPLGSNPAPYRHRDTRLANAVTPPRVQTGLYEVTQIRITGLRHMPFVASPLQPALGRTEGTVSVYDKGEVVLRAGASVVKVPRAGAS